MNSNVCLRYLKTCWKQLYQIRADAIASQNVTNYHYGYLAKIVLELSYNKPDYRDTGIGIVFSYLFSLNSFSPTFCHKQRQLELLFLDEVRSLRIRSSGSGSLRTCRRSLERGRPDVNLLEDDSARKIGPTFLVDQCRRRTLLQVSSLWW